MQQAEMIFLRCLLKTQYIVCPKVLFSPISSDDYLEIYCGLLKTVSSISFVSPIAPDITDIYLINPA
jgi:hypothetical protein